MINTIKIEMAERYAIVVAGGSGSRFGGDTPKQFMLLAGQPVLMHTIIRMACVATSVTVVLPEEHIERWRDLCREYAFTEPHEVVAGGMTRFESVKRGLFSLSLSPGDVVAVHDGVRPLCSTALVERAFATAAAQGSAIPVVEVTDSVRLVMPTGRSSALDRSTLRAVQTPQAFNAFALREAYCVDYSPRFTDDASVMEQAGHEMTLIEGEPSNIKITRPVDLVVAQYILSHGNT